MRYLCFIIALTLSTLAMGADENMVSGPAKPKPGAPAAPAVPAGKEETLTGQLGSSSVGALATLRIKPEKGSVRAIQIWGDVEIAKQVGAILKKKSDAEITGMVTPDGANMKATKVVEVEKKKK